MADKCHCSQSNRQKGQNISANDATDVFPQELSEWLQETSFVKTPDEWENERFPSKNKTDREQTCTFYPVYGINELDSSSSPSMSYEEMTHDNSSMSNSQDKQGRELDASLHNQRVPVIRSTSAPPCMQPASRCMPLGRESSTDSEPRLNIPPHCPSTKRRKVILHEIWGKSPATEKKQDNPGSFATDQYSQHPPVRRFSSSGFAQAMHKAQDSQQELLDWDRLMGLKASHSKTMSSSQKSRKKLFEAQKGLTRDLNKDFLKEQAKDF